MRRSPWFRPPRLVLTLFLGITAVLSATMGALAWRLVDLDGRLASQRVVERLDGAADAAVVLDQILTETTSRDDEPARY